MCEPCEELCSLKQTCSAQLQNNVFNLCRSTEQGSQYKSASKRPSLLGHLAEAATTTKPVAAVPEQPTRQKRLQQCSNDATILESIPAPQQGSAASAGEVAACPICGIKLSMQELTLHLEQELANLEEDNSTSAAPVKQDNTPKERHVACGGVAPSKHHIPTGSSTLSHNYKASKPAAVQKSQKASLALTHAMTNVQLTIVQYQVQVLVLGGDHTKAQSNPNQPRKPRPAVPIFDHYTGGAGAWVCTYYTRLATIYAY